MGKSEADFSTQTLHFKSFYPVFKMENFTVKRLIDAEEINELAKLRNHCLSTGVKSLLSKGDIIYFHIILMRFTAFLGRNASKTILVFPSVTMTRKFQNKHNVFLGTGIAKS